MLLQTSSRPGPDTRAPGGNAPPPRRRFYVPVRAKFASATLLGIAWCALSVWLSQAWLHDLGELIGAAPALFVIAFIAYVPGFMNAFMAGSILLDRRPRRRRLAEYPGVTVLVACYNEAANIGDTLTSLFAQDYPGPLEVLVLDDGSTDDSAAIAERAIAAATVAERHRFRVVRGERNVGKAGVLNRGLTMASHELIVTIDGDSWAFRDALTHIVERYHNDPPDTRAVAGSVLVRNSRHNWLTRAQEWDYFHGIAAVKRMQSLYHGTLVAQGAFSLYDRAALRDVGGWPESVGEDIVVSWALLSRGWRIGYAEDAILFTNVPDRLAQFARQRKRWSRGLFEAFRAYPGLLVKPRMSLMFIWWNLLFLPLDLVYTFAFIPGVVLALFGHYWIAGPLTLAVLPLAVLWNMAIFRVQNRVFRAQALRVRRNYGGFSFYVLAYSMILQPVCVWGYVSELLGLRKRWGTK